MKKTIVTLALVAAVGLAGIGLAEARWGGGGGWMMGGGGGYGHGPGYCNGPGGWNSESIDIEARQEFRKDTSELREQIYEKRREYAEVVRQENPDKELAKQLWSELFDLQNEMREKAQAAGMMKFSSKK